MPPDLEPFTCLLHAKLRVDLDTAQKVCCPVAALKPDSDQ